MNIRKATTAICEAIISDEGYRASWVANVAMSVYDELTIAMPEMDFAIKKRVSNQSAERFIDVLTAGVKNDN